MIKKSHLFVSLILITVLILGWYYFRYHFNLLGGCGETKSLSLNSEDKVKSVDLILINCGATTDYSTVVVLKNTDSEKNIFSVKGHNVENIKIEWLDNSRLKIKFNGDKSKIENQLNSFEGTQINYELNP